jgi:UDP-2,3-diacylglucosamine pyrophosphatase LpxH
MGSRPLNLSKVVVKHLPLLDRLAAMNATYILGNHDADLDSFVGTEFLSHPLFQRMCGPFERQIGGKRFMFMHGHEVDPLNSGDTPGKGRICCILAGMREDKNGSPVLPDGEFVEDHLEEIGDILEDIAVHFKRTETRLTGSLGWLPRQVSRRLRRKRAASARHFTPAQNPDRAKEMLTLYRQDMEDNGYDVLIAGHTHHPGHIEDWYFNSGTWARKTNNFVQIGPDGDAAVFDWVNGRPVVNKTVLEM